MARILPQRAVAQQKIQPATTPGGKDSSSALWRETLPRCNANESPRGTSESAQPPSSIKEVNRPSWISPRAVSCPADMLYSRRNEEPSVTWSAPEPRAPPSATPLTAVSRTQSPMADSPQRLPPPIPDLLRTTADVSTMAPRAYITVTVTISPLAPATKGTLLKGPDPLSNAADHPAEYPGPPAKRPRLSGENALPATEVTTASATAPPRATGQSRNNNPSAVSSEEVTAPAVIIMRSTAPPATEGQPEKCLSPSFAEMPAAVGDLPAVPAPASGCSMSAVPVSTTRCLQVTDLNTVFFTQANDVPAAVPAPMPAAIALEQQD
ncbi:uncharacterized protein [Engystomops pustulosus]|uniref:uncharacterized protein n=1 Tax=Engystomops pustulosus TaxID=76066 RepID=UPI003AFAAF2B